MLVLTLAEEFPKDAKTDDIIAKLLEPWASFDVESFARED